MLCCTIRRCASPLFGGFLGCWLLLRSSAEAHKRKHPECPHPPLSSLLVRGARNRRRLWWWWCVCGVAPPHDTAMHRHATLTARAPQHHTQERRAGRSQVESAQKHTQSRAADVDHDKHTTTHHRRPATTISAALTSRALGARRRRPRRRSCRASRPRALVFSYLRAWALSVPCNGSIRNPVDSVK